MPISMIWAMGKNRELGKNNSLPWHLPADLKHFKEITSRKTVIMGQRTFFSLGKALPNRRNIIVTFEKFDAPGCELVYSIDEAISKVLPGEEAFIIGGATIYRQFLPHVSKLYITFVDGNFDADLFFPVFDLADFKLVSESKREKDEKNPYDLYFKEYIRKI